jgi:hypothetical protein
MLPFGKAPAIEWTISLPFPAAIATSMRITFEFFAKAIE